MQGLAVVAGGGQLVEILAGLAIVVLVDFQETRVVVGRKPRQQGVQRGADIPDQPHGQLGPAAQMMTANIDLDDIAVVGEEIAIREIGAQHHQQVAFLERLVTRREPDQAGHAYVEGVVVFQRLLAAQGVDDRGFKLLG